MASRKAKLAAIGGISLAAISVVAGGAFAFFTDEAEGATTGKAGNVEITMSEVALSNPDNINPGDGDETLPEGARPGTEHLLTFGVDNAGNKSIMTRNVVTLSLEDGKDISVFSLRTADGELTEKFLSADGTDFVPAAQFESEYYAPVAVRYVTTQVALNGVGENAEVEDGVEATDVDYTYELKLAKEAEDEYELSNLKVDVEVQAMQYRNTTDGEWETLFAETLK